MRTALALMAGAAAVTLLHAATLRPGHVWGGDFSLYLMHARNLATGQPYAATPFVANPAAPEHSPAVFPPAYPLMLAPAWAMRGPELSAFKLVTLAWLPVLFVAYALLAGIVLAPAGAAAFATSLMLHPAFFAWRDFITPEIPLAAAIGLFLLAEASCERRGITDRRAPTVGLALGGLSFFAFAISPQGIACIVALIARDLLTTRRIRTATMVAGITLAALTVASDASFRLGLVAGFQRSVGVRLAWLPAHAEQLARSGLQVWATGLPRAMQVVAALGLLGFVASGLRTWRQSPITTAVCLLASSLLIGLLSPFPAIPNSIDVVMPLVPITLLLAWQGVGAGNGRRRARLATQSVLAAVLLIGYAAGFRAALEDPIDNDVLQPSFLELRRFICSQTPAHARIAFSNPRVLALYTDRAAFVLPATTDPTALWNSVESLKGSHLLLTRFAPEEAQSLDSLVRMREAGMVRRFHNEDFDLYELSPPPSRPASSGAHARVWATGACDADGLPAAAR
jgi:hypothetical protein